MKVVGYCRLSRDEDRENYASIVEQKRILTEYAISRNWTLSDDSFYIDDNCSGYTLDRPAFTKMITKVKKGEIDVVLAKDLSRIGRNNGKVLVLLDEFKNMQKNLILVSEMGGTYDVLNDRDDCIGITTWFNERYVKDCSKKTRDHMYSKQKSGRLIMGNYYGYIKDKNDITKLIMDENIKTVVKKIFELYIEGYGMKKISDILNEKYDYPTPSVYYQKRHLEQGKIYKHPVQRLWTNYMINNIISNDVYCGTLRTHKKKTISIRGKAIKLPESEHFIFENHHEPMVSKEVFELANQIRKRKNELKTKKGNEKRNYFFGGLCRCYDCGMAVSGIMTRRKNPKKAYECNQYKSYGTKRCKVHEILEEDIYFQFKEFLKATKIVYKNEISKVKMNVAIQKKESSKAKIMQNLRQAENEYRAMVSQKIKDLSLLNSKVQIDLVTNTYKNLEEEKINTIIKFKSLLEKEEPKLKQEKIKELGSAIELFDKIISSKEPDRAVLERLIQTIWLYSENKMVRFDLKPNITELISNNFNQSISD